MFRKLKESYKQTTDETQKILNNNTQLVNGLSRGLLHSILLIISYVFKYCIPMLTTMFVVRSVMDHNPELAKSLHQFYTLLLFTFVIAVMVKIFTFFVKRDNFGSEVRQNILLFIGLLVSMANIISVDKLKTYSYLDLVVLVTISTVIYMVTNFGVNALLLNRFNADEDEAFSVESYTVSYDHWVLGLNKPYTDVNVKVARIKTVYTENFSLGFVTTSKSIELHPDEDLIPVKEMYLNDMMDTIDTVYQNLDKLPKVNTESKPQKSDDPNHLHALRFSKVHDVNEDDLKSNDKVVPFKLKRTAASDENESGESHDTNE